MSLTKIKTHNNMNAICDGSFSGCTSLKAIHYNGSLDG